MQQNSRCRLSGDRDETIIHIISECSKLAQIEYKSRHDWVGKVIHWELYYKLKFEHTNKWYMHNLESVLENEMHRQNSLGFRDTNELFKLSQTTRHSDNQQKSEFAELWTLPFLPTTE